MILIRYFSEIEKAVVSVNMPSNAVESIRLVLDAFVCVNVVCGDAKFKREAKKRKTMYLRFNKSAWLRLAAHTSACPKP